MTRRNLIIPSINIGRCSTRNIAVRREVQERHAIKLHRVVNLFLFISKLYVSHIQINRSIQAVGESCSFTSARRSYFSLFFNACLAYRIYISYIMLTLSADDPEIEAESE